jgi:tRNA nucleotidyltransferase/poly(A) polymerase
MNKNNLVRGSVISIFVLLYLLVSVISTIHVIDFFEMSNPYWLAVTLAIAFELGAAASLASLVILKKMNKGLVWALFITITLMQMQGNMYYAFKNIQDYQSWSELFNLIEEEVIYQKRVLALVSGAILPLVALGFIKSLVDYIKPEEEKEEGDLEAPSDSVFDNVEGMRKVVDAHDSLVEEIENVKEKENWDEDHALDVVLNSMATDLEEEEEIAAWKETLNDGLDELEEVEEPEVEDIGLDNMIEVIEDQLRPKEEAIENLTETLTETAEDEDLLAKALREKAKVEMDDYLKSREDDQEVAN